MISMIVVSKYCLADFFAKGVPHLGKKYCFFAGIFFCAEGTPFLDPVGGGEGLGGESLLTIKSAKQYLTPSLKVFSSFHIFLLIPHFCLAAF